MCQTLKHRSDISHRERDVELELIGRRFTGTVGHSPYLEESYTGKPRGPGPASTLPSDHERSGLFVQDPRPFAVGNTLVPARNRSKVCLEHKFQLTQSLHQAP